MFMDNFDDFFFLFELIIALIIKASFFPDKEGTMEFFFWFCLIIFWGIDDFLFNSPFQIRC